MIRYEWKMIMRNRLCKALLLSVIFFAIFLSYLAIENSINVDEDSAEGNSLVAVRQLMEEKNQCRGPLTPVRIREIVEKGNALDRNGLEGKSKENKPAAFFDIAFFASSAFYGEHTDDDDSLAILREKPHNIEKIYDRYRENLKAESKEYGKTKEQREFLLKKFQEIKMPVHYEAFQPWEGVFKYIEVFSIILLIISAFFSARIFAQEFRYRSDSVFFSTLHGRGKAIRGKIVSGLLMTTILYWVGIGLLCLLCFSVMGTSGGKTMFQFDAPYAIYIVSFRQLCGIAALCGYIACLLASSISMLIAAKTRVTIIAIVIPLLLFLITPFIARNISIQYDFLMLMPYHLNNILNCSRIPYIFQLGSFVFRQIPFLMLAYSGLAVALLPLTYQCYKKTTVNS